MAKQLSRIGIFGGSFDPPHIGHLVIAELARLSMKLDVVFFVPAYRPPHKKGKHPSTAAERLAMTRLSVKGNPHLRASDIELRRKGTSYTVDTVRAFRRQFPSAKLYLIIGSDSLLQFHSWKQPAEILDLASLIVYRRPHSAPMKERARTRFISFVQGPRMSISSSEVRKRIRENKPIRYLVRDNVLAFIRRKKLYTGSSSKTKP